MGTLAAVAAVGAAQIPGAVLTGLYDIAAGIGALVMLSGAIVAVLACLMVAGDIRHKRQQNRYTATQPNPAQRGEVGDDTLRMLRNVDVDAELERWLREGGRG